MIEALIVFMKRAVRDEEVTEDVDSFSDYLFALLRSIAILIPPALAVACNIFLQMLCEGARNGYHG